MLSVGDRVRHKNLPEYGLGLVTCFICNYQGTDAYQIVFDQQRPNIFCEDVLVLDVLETLADLI